MMEQIAQQLWYQPGFRFLELERTIEDDKDGFLSMIEALEQNNSVRYIYLCGEFFDSLDSKQRRLLLKASGSLRSLQCLYMANAKLSIEAVGDLAHSLSNNSTNATIQEISFQHLHIQDGVVLDGLVKAVAKLPAVERVEIGVLFIHHAQAVVSLESLGELCESKTLKALTMIDLRLNQHHFQTMAEVLSTNDQLSELSLWGETLDQGSCLSIADMLRRNSSLSAISLFFGKMDNGGMEAVFASVGESENVRSFSIENEEKDSITTSGMLGMSHMVANNRQLQSLSVATKALDDDGCAHLCQALKDHPMLRELSLDNSMSSTEVQSSIGNSHSQISGSIGRRGFDALSGMLRTNKSIRRLDLSGISMDQAGAIALASSIKKNSTLQELSLGPIKLEPNASGTAATESRLDKVFKALEDLLEYNTVVEKISMEHDALTLSFGGRINLLLSLNQSKLRTLMVDVNTLRESFLDKLADSSYSTDLILYMLMNNPSLMASTLAH